MDLLVKWNDEVGSFSKSIHRGTCEVSYRDQSSAGPFANSPDRLRRRRAKAFLSVLFQRGVPAVFGRPRGTNRKGGGIAAYQAAGTEIGVDAFSIRRDRRTLNWLLGTSRGGGINCHLQRKASPG